LKHPSLARRIQGVQGLPSSDELALGPAVRPWSRGSLLRDEASLVRQAKRGSADAVEVLVRRHWNGAHRAAFLIVQDAAAAEDIAQEAMLAAVRAIEGFDRRRPFRPWLHRIVVNRSLDWLRARKRRPEVSVEVARPPAATSPQAHELSEELMDALGALAPQQRTLIVMRHLLGYRSTELARMLDLPPGTVRTRLARALEALRALLDDQARERA
jgi:RNA polymerase sigma-70 factor (ECF subfamily)